MSMAKKIIKKGNIPTVTKTCEVCGCEFSFECGDVEYNSICSCEGFVVENIILIALAAKRE